VFVFWGLIYVNLCIYDDFMAGDLSISLFHDVVPGFNSVYALDYVSTFRRNIKFPSSALRSRLLFEECCFWTYPSSSVFFSLKKIGRWIKSKSKIIRNTSQHRQNPSKWIEISVSPLLWLLPTNLHCDTEDGDSMFLRNTRIYLRVYMASEPRTSSSSSSPSLKLHTSL
jgi:hypothetical protein